jgi:hypothetical protein
MAAEAEALAAFALDAILEVVVTHAGLVVAEMHRAQHGTPALLQPKVDGAPQSVPPYHEAFLQAARGTMKLPSSQEHQHSDLLKVLGDCMPALDWALQCLLERLQGEVAAAGSSQPDLGECCNSSGGGAAEDFHSMRLLPHLPALLSELVALQPGIGVLSNVSNLSFKCLGIGLQLRISACGEQPSLSGSRTKAQGLAITKGLFGACLEVLVPVQQHLATHGCSMADGTAIGGSGRHASTGDVVTGCDQHADADPDVAIFRPTAKSLGGLLFRVLAGSLTAFDHGECMLWQQLTRCSC